VGWTTTLVLAEAREALEGAELAQRGHRPARDRDGFAAMLRIDVPPTADERFDDGLQVLIEGIAARQARHGRGGGTGT